MDKKFKPLSNTKKSSPRCRLFNGFAPSHLYEGKCSTFCPREQPSSVCSMGEPQSASVWCLSGILPRDMPQQDEHKPQQVFCPLFLAPLACTETALALIRQISPLAIAVQEKEIFKVLDQACSMSLYLALCNTG